MAEVKRSFRAPVIVLHGGCGGLAEEFEYNERQTLSSPPTYINKSEVANLRGEQRGIREAAVRGWQVLKAGGSAIDAVEQAVVILEDDPEFNAGTGASLTREKMAEMDALIMEGESLQMGAVCSVKNVRNPIRLARHVMDHCSPHVFFSADNAKQLAVTAGLEMQPNEKFYSEKSLHRWTLAHEKATQTQNQTSKDTCECEKGSGTGTVGAVALDMNGLLASATSTGGLTYKKPGRVGDTPCVGAGGFADNNSGALSATGVGEAIMRMTLCRLAASFIENNGENAQTAVEKALAKMRDRIGSSAGLIAVDRNGVPGVHYTTEYMTWAVVDADGLLHFGSQPNEHLVEKLE